ncbi:MULTISPECIES: hypothetical protein [Pseudoalteromonas]|uniref:hypothetical protein n=1 Tax=Pseudoalteromonas TaxID=53246 RepID=UPI001B37160D|nr:MULTISPECIES: hypothetical protein [Pseudoalteromonas]MBQ4838835.1 hypothetical protein [Pseudoalteromonas luteoviolacea]MCG7548576.1 hypothetical protein [Pseudoalteromonas sp. Of7M-16]
MIRTDVAASVSASTSGVGGVTVASGLLENISVYAPLIGLLISFISLILSVVFFLMSRADAKRQGDKTDANK